MKRKDPAIKLLIRSVVMLAFVVVLCRVTDGDRHALAGDSGDILTSDVELVKVVDTIIKYSSSGPERLTPNDTSKDLENRENREDRENSEDRENRENRENTEDFENLENHEAPENLENRDTQPGSSAGYAVADAHMQAGTAGADMQGTGLQSTQTGSDAQGAGRTGVQGTQTGSDAKDTDRIDAQGTQAGEQGTQAGNRDQGAMSSGGASSTQNDSGSEASEIREAGYTDADDFGDSELVIPYPPTHGTPAADVQGTVSLYADKEAPAGSAQERFEYLTDNPIMTCTVGNMPAGYQSAAEAKQHMVEVTVPVRMLDESDNISLTSLTITVNERLAHSVSLIFDEIFNEEPEFCIFEVKGYSYHKITGVGRSKLDLMSTSSLGAAIDINYRCSCNSLFVGAGNDLRDKTDIYCITDGVIEIFKRHGWYWGGDYNDCCETYHFQYLALEDLASLNPDPFPTMLWGKMDLNPEHVKNLQGRLVSLGYLDRIYTAYNAEVDLAVMEFQKDYGLDAFGIVDKSTWTALINATYGYEYVF